MKIFEIINELERVAPPALQEDYDNSGLIVGSPNAEVHKALLCLDSTEAVVDEAIASGCNLIIAHHPIVFKGLKRFNGSNYVERTVLKAIQNNIAIYACHTNLDNVLEQGVNSMIAEKLGLINSKILKPKQGLLLKLVVFVPVAHTAAVLQAMFDAGAGQIGNYKDCSFSSTGTGTFTAEDNTNAFVGTKGVQHSEKEQRCEVMVPTYGLQEVIQALLGAHPYEEVAYDVLSINNRLQTVGSGLIGELPVAMNIHAFLGHLKTQMELPMVRYTQGASSEIRKVALCGGSGSFLIPSAMSSGADVYITADVKYHEFFEGQNALMICDIGHYESEKYTIHLFSKILSLKFPNFATIFAKTLTNPVNYYY